MKPELSIVLPVFNDPEGCRTTVNSLLEQTAPQEVYEIIVVDNGSTDSTYQIAKSMAASNDNVHLFVNNAIQSSYAARNTGIENSKAPIIAFIDANMWVSKDYVERVLELMEDGRVYMGCDIQVVAKSKQTTITRYSKARAFRIENQIRMEKFAPTASLVVRKEIFESVGMFDEALISGGDLEFGQRIHIHGFDLVFEPDIVLYHPARSTIISLLKRQFRFGRGSVQRKHRYPDRYQQRSVWDLRRILPPKPTTFINQYEDHSTSTHELLFWLFLSWMIKLSNTVGRFYQKFLYLREKVMWHDYPG